MVVPLNPAGYLQKTKSTVLFYTPSSLHVERQKPALRKEKTTHGPTGHHPCGAVGSVWAGAAPRAGATSCLHSALRRPRAPQPWLPLSGRRPDADRSSRGHPCFFPGKLGRAGLHAGDPLRDSATSTATSRAHRHEDEGRPLCPHHPEPRIRRSEWALGRPNLPKHGL